jgi:hypothetical protein
VHKCGGGKAGRGSSCRVIYLESHDIYCGECNPDLSLDFSST